MTIVYRLPVRDTHRYFGPDPDVIKQMSFSSGALQLIITKHLCIQRALHFLTNDGHRFVTDFESTNPFFTFGERLHQLLNDHHAQIIDLHPAIYSLIVADIRDNGKAANVGS